MNYVGICGTYMHIQYIQLKNMAYIVHVLSVVGTFVYGTYMAITCEVYVELVLFGTYMY